MVLLRQNTHIHTYTGIHTKCVKQVIPSRRSTKRKRSQGLLLALEDLTAYLFINENKAQLVFNSRKRDMREEMVIDGLYDLFSPM